MHSTDQPVVAVLVAAGSGSRLGAAVPKALVELAGVPLVRLSAEALVAGGVQQVVVTIPGGMDAPFEQALAGLRAPLRIVAGGSTRQESVRLGLKALNASDDAVVLVHDAARALVPPALVASVVEAIADGAAAAVPVLPVTDSIRQLTASGSVVVDRSALRAVQTPQAARLGALRDAHEHARVRGLEVTDDAAVCELVGLDVTLVPGHSDAMKVTTPADLVVATAILEERRRP
ncbi:2-C-methyl-D-erythritol 4-phosphate cytidylyltransferase [Tessaracoccus flavus]|uniref:2-C-methyl-D-erythritol 4-phosphate cytidylyltransferase n=1 Tax=Tessaracoccus flavus TaxID=1610493 RepID=UPI0008983A61|nr:2-C-methyl-D-erythritol 4-phosphate cytidylyltransferase [Tessaracoccus flavus]SDY49381.1 2-C-methyl-D-erythritol 4-phosphate cytidylyltransferase [Tessaracoccus flavus]